MLVFRDVTEERKLAQQLSHQATHDTLTGLVNRPEFERRLSHLLGSANPHAPHALLYLDLDQFKVVNDTCGHAAGDDLLRQISALLRTKLRARDTLARLGGDEFGVLLEHCPRARGQAHCQLAAGAAARLPFRLDRQELYHRGEHRTGADHAGGRDAGRCVQRRRQLLLRSEGERQEPRSRLSGRRLHACRARRRDALDAAHSAGVGRRALSPVLPADPAGRLRRARWSARRDSDPNGGRSGTHSAARRFSSSGRTLWSDARARSLGSEKKPRSTVLPPRTSAAMSRSRSTYRDSRWVRPTSWIS